MCGISGILSTNNEQRLNFITNATRLMQHRGPDSKGFWSDDKSISLAHNRLAILDLTNAGYQPIHSSCSRYIMSYNGEIYNHLLLRDHYLPNYNFKSSTDSETIIELYRILGPDMLKEFVGMWAILIWDNEEKTLFISRDRFGQKPLYFLKRDDFLAFSSEIKPLLTLLDQPKADVTMISEYLAMGNYDHLAESTFFDEIKQLRPSHYTIVNSYNFEFTSTEFWKLPVLYERHGCKATSEYLVELKTIIEEAVLSQTLSDVPLGVSLSGGIDSSVITGILAKHHPNNFKVFTAQTIGSKYDESQYVKAVLRNIPEEKCKLESIELNNLVSLDDLDKLLCIQEEPFGDPSIMANYLLMQLAKKNDIKVILSGQGADEIFFGYSHSVNAILAHCVRHFKFKIILDWIKNGELGLNLWLRIILAALFPSFEMKLRKWSRNTRKKRLARNFLDNSVDIVLHRLSDINHSWEDSIRGIHIPHLVHYDDRNAMSQSIEGRMPFLDHRIIEKLSLLKPSEFVIGGKRKSILRMACEEYLPVEVLDRRDKIGFYTPLESILTNWVKTNSGSQISKELNEYNINQTLLCAMETFRQISFKKWAIKFKLLSE